MAGEFADADDNVCLLVGVGTDLLMILTGLVAQLGHAAQECNAALSRLRELGEPIEPQTHRQRVGVVAVVDDRHAAEAEFVQSTLCGTELGQRGLDRLLGNAQVQRDHLGDIARKVGTATGQLHLCEFRKGWFDDTMPKFSEPISAAFLDVDLAASTWTCLAYLYPLLVPGGVIFSHDGHLPLCMAVFRDASLWREIGGPPPVFSGLGTRKLISIMKPQ